MPRTFALLGALLLAASLLPAWSADKKSGKLEMFTGAVTSYTPGAEIAVAKKKQKLTCAIADTPMKGTPKPGDVVTVTYEEVNGKLMCRSVVVKYIEPRTQGVGAKFR